MKLTTIEDIAKFLLRNRISFEYSEKFLKVINTEFVYTVFETATYHCDTKELILMDYHFNKVEIDKFINLVAIYKNYN